MNTLRTRAQLSNLLATLAIFAIGATLPYESAHCASIDLDSYVLGESYGNIGSEQNPDPVVDNLSGITYNTATDSLFSVLNGPEIIVEIDPQNGEILRTVTLDNFDDTEGIIHLGGSRFGVVEERDRNFVTFDLTSSTTSIDRDNAIVSTIIPLGDPGANSRNENSGLEGVAYDPMTDTIYVVWEKESPTIRSFDLSMAEASPSFTPAMSTPFIASTIVSPTTLQPFTDLAGLHFHSPTNTLLILGEENKEIVEIDPATGAIQPGSILLDGTTHPFMAQPEGITVGPDGTLYVVGEADDLFVFLSVPEPSSLALLLLSTSALLQRRRP